MSVTAARSWGRQGAVFGRGVLTSTAGIDGGENAVVDVSVEVCRHGTARHGTARHGTARHGTARHGTVCVCVRARVRACVCSRACACVAGGRADTQDQRW